jgi:proteasome lid subunit RPN8/RPN11
MEDDGIRVYPTEVEQALTPKPPPGDCMRFPIGGLHVYVSQEAVVTVLKHARETPDRECGGALVGGFFTKPGPPGADPVAGGAYVEIRHAVPGRFSIGSAVSLTFTTETWSQILDSVEQLYPKERIVGWYHTHPNHGIFLSGPDRFIQNHFFGHGNLVALVVDHIRRRGGFFVGNESSADGIRQSEEFEWDDATLGLPPLRRLAPLAPAPPPEALLVEPIPHDDVEAVVRIDADDIVRADAQPIAPPVARPIAPPPRVYGAPAPDLRPVSFTDSALLVLFLGLAAMLAFSALVFVIVPGWLVSTVLMVFGQPVGYALFVAGLLFAVLLVVGVFIFGARLLRRDR